MDMGFSAEQTAMRDALRKFFAAEYPIGVAREAMHAAAAYDASVWRKMGGLGFLGTAIPERYGGAGLGLEELAILYEEFGRSLYQGPHFGSVLLCGQLLIRLGSEEQKREMLPAVASGEKILALALLEKDARWEEASIRARVRPTADGWRLSGTKLLVTHADAAHEVLWLARDEAAGGVSLFRVRDRTALHIAPMPSTFGHLYWEVRLRDVRVGPEDLVGAAGGAWAAVAEVLDWAAALQCAELVGLAQRILELSVEYAKTRVQFGHPIGSYQGIQHVLADMATRVDAARLLAHQAVSLLSGGRKAEKELAMAKAYVNEAAYQVALDGMQVHGGVGYMMEHPLPYYVQRVLYGKMNLGDTDVYLERIARALPL